MAKSQDIEDFEHVLEKIIFDEDELTELKSVVGEFKRERTWNSGFQPKAIIIREKWTFRNRSKSS